MKDIFRQVKPSDHPETMIAKQKAAKQSEGRQSLQCNKQGEKTRGDKG